MEEILYKSIQSKANISLADFSLIEAALTIKILRKKKVLLSEGEICKQVAFVNSGCLRSYSVDTNGNEHIVQLALRNHWVGDLYSFLNQTPSTLYIDAIEDSELLLLSHTKLDALYLQVPCLERYFRILFQNAYLSTQQRLNSTLSISAEERYKKLLGEHPELLQKVPLIYIASYLGITPESLSRIRRNIL